MGSFRQVRSNASFACHLITFHLFPAAVRRPLRIIYEYGFVSQPSVRLVDYGWSRFQRPPSSVSSFGHFLNPVRLVNSTSPQFVWSTARHEPRHPPAPSKIRPPAFPLTQAVHSRIVEPSAPNWQAAAGVIRRCRLQLVVFRAIGPLDGPRKIAKLFVSGFSGLPRTSSRIGPAGPFLSPYFCMGVLS